MTYTPLPTFNTGDSFTAATWNTIRDNFAAGPPDIFTTKGDLPVGQSNQVVGRLPVGADGRILIADSAQALGIKWDRDRLTELAAAKGDVFAALGANSITRVAVGTNNYLLTSDSAQSAGVRWAAEPILGTITTKGDLIYMTGSKAIGRLGVGVNGQVLRRTSTNPSWGIDPVLDIYQAKGDLLSYQANRLPVGANNLWLQEDESNSPTHLNYCSMDARAFCTINSSQSIADGTRIQFNSVYDPDGAVTTGVNWQYTCPANKTGWYLVMAVIYTDAQEWMNKTSAIRIKIGTTTVDSAGYVPRILSSGVYMVAFAVSMINILKTGETVYLMGAGDTFNVSSNPSSYIMIQKIFPR